MGRVTITNVEVELLEVIEPVDEVQEDINNYHNKEEV